MVVRFDEGTCCRTGLGKWFVGQLKVFICELLMMCMLRKIWNERNGMKAHVEDDDDKFKTPTG